MTTSTAPRKNAPRVNVTDRDIAALNRDKRAVHTFTVTVDAAGGLIARPVFRFRGRDEQDVREQVIAHFAPVPVEILSVT